MSLFPDSPGMRVRKCRAGDRVRLVVLRADEKKRPIWVIEPAVLIVGRFSVETVSLHEEAAWKRSQAEKAMCPIACEIDRDARVVPVLA